MTRKVQLTSSQKAAAVDRIGENIALLSGAGCGKTYVLARRFTELLLDGKDKSDPLSRLVALTFTEKAALEMSRRVREMLAQFASSAKKSDRQRLRDWLNRLPEARISTIHSFCSSVLRSYAIEAGIDPAFSLCADQLLADKMLTEATEQAIIQAVEARSPNACEALLLTSFDELARQVFQLVQWRTEWKGSDYDDPAETIRRWQAIKSAERLNALDSLASDKDWRDLIADARSLSCPNSEDKLAEQVEAVLKFASDPSSASPEDIAFLKDKLGKTGRADNWGGKDAMGRAKDTVSEAVKRTKKVAIYFEHSGQLDLQSAQMLAALTGLAEQAKNIYARQKRRRGLLDFTDLLAETGKLLSDKPELREAIAGKIDQLLIDEAQDTSGFQLSLLERLMFGRPKGQSHPAGRLFVIGDAKQSIYRFRGAQVKVFEDLCVRLRESQQEKLSISFRTHEAGVAFVNRLFKPLLGQSYEPIEANRKACPPHPSVEILLASPGDQAIDKADQANDLQAQLTAQRICEIVTGGQKLVWDRKTENWREAQYGDIAILFARMTKSLAYERRLADAGIPYYVVAGTGFFKQQEIFDVLNALRAIDKPFDDIALVGLLRSSMVGMDDNALMSIAESMDPPYLPKLLECGPGAIGLNAEQSEALDFALGMIEELGKLKDAVTIDELIRQILVRTGFEAVLLAQKRGKRLVGNIRQLIHRAASASADGMTLSEFIAQSGEYVMNEARHEQANVSEEAGNVVRLMTVHKAKGLEFPVVIIPDINASRKGSNASLLNNPDWGLTVKIKDDRNDGSDDKPLFYRLAEAREKSLEAEEFIRQMYVAVTRHRDHLVIVGANWRTTKGRFREAGSFLTKLDEVLGLSDVLESGKDEFQYDQDRHRAVVRSVRPSPPVAEGLNPTIGKKIVSAAANAGEIASGIARVATGAQELPLVGRIPSDVGKARLSVTALCDFQRCQMLYKWRHQLLTPPMRTTGKEHGATPTPDPATVGTIYHRCMELLDFENPQPASALVIEAMDELAPQWKSRVGDLSADFEEMLACFRKHELCDRISHAKQTLRELEFVTQTDWGTLTGKIDLLFEDREGAWHIVDYKSDRVTEDELTHHASLYELQMLCYAGAAESCLGQPPESAELYFLRPGRSHSFRTTHSAIKDWARKATELGGRLITARRTDNYEKEMDENCRWCPFRCLCEKGLHRMD